jgi:radical SAM superfamily enzyme YgiQ (UPF0313 family)
MNANGRPSILVLYPSAFNYPGWLERVHVKTSQLMLCSYLAQWYPVEYADLEVTIGRPSTPPQVRRFERKVREFFAERQFDILAISCWTSLSYRATMTVARLCRETHPNAVVVVGGYHPSARPEEFFTSDQLVDYVVSGEGELTLRQIAEGLATVGRPAGTQMISAPTLPPGEFVPIDWSLIEDFIHQYVGSPVNNLCIYTSRGCPFVCSFCMEWLKERGWRPFPPEMAAEEAHKAVMRLNSRSIGIADACFGVRSEWRKRFLRRLAEFHPDYWVVFETRAEYIDEQDAEILTGMKSQVQFGLESGSPRMLQLMRKTKDPARFLRHFSECSRMLSSYGVLHNANLIFNHPGETEESLRETFALMDQELEAGNNSLMWAVFSFMDFPGCEIDKNRDFYRKNFGTRFLSPDWWREDIDQFDACRHSEPSDDLSGSRVGLWQQLLNERDDRLRNVLTDKAFRFAAESYFRHWQDDPRFTQG